MKPPCVVFGLDENGGFYSTLFYLCKAYLTAETMRIPFYINDTRWPYRGWHTYFRTLEKYPATRPLSHTLSPPYRVAHNAQYNDPDFLLPQYAAALREIYKLQPYLVQRVNSLLASLGPSFVAVFVRRGCKLVEEASFIPAREIYERLQCSPDTVLFIQTDDYTVVEEFRAIHPADKVVATVSPSKRGQYHVRRLLNESRNPHAHTIVPLLEQSESQVRQETEEMLVGLEVCRQAPVCWTDVTSNVGRFLKLMGRNVHVYPRDAQFDMAHRGCPAHELPLL